MDNEIFAIRFKELRINANVTQTEVSRYLGITKATVSYYESGKRLPSNMMIRKIANYFKVPVDYLLGMDYIMEDSNDEYLKDDTLLKIIRRSKKLSSFILDDPRTNVKLLEKFIENLGK
jgi:transcriptional regulator with XRE-family HTH domain